MDGKPCSSTDARGSEPTVEVGWPAHGPSSHQASGPARCVSLVEGTNTEMSAEIQAVLRGRLRVAALLLCAGFAIFLIRSLVFRSVDSGWPSAVSRVQGTGVLAVHIVVTAVLALCGMSLCRRCTIATSLLRAKELLIFGLPAAFFLYLQYLDMTTCAARGFLPNPAAGWLVLIFTYALFIPNNWPRAAVVIGTLAAAPVVMSLLLVLLDEACSQVADAGSFVSSVTLLMAVSAIAAVMGVDSIGGLRSQAFEARQLGQYHLRQLIGSGGMGEVHLAEHRLLKRPCAIKLIRPDKAGDPRVLARFEREVRTIARLSHWNSVDVFDYGRAADGTFYYVMEYLPGMNLNEMVHRYGPLPPERVIHFLVQTCDALEERTGWDSSIATSSRPICSQLTAVAVTTWLSCWILGWPNPCRPARLPI